MRSCSRKTNLRMLKGMGYSDVDYDPLLYRPWFMFTMLILWITSLIILAVA